MIQRRIALLGAGNMGRALIGGLLRSGTRAEALSVGEPFAPARAALARELGVSALGDNARAIEGATLVLLAVKPSDAQAVLEALAPRLTATRPLLVSVCAGVRLEALERWCGPGVPVVRAIPNRPALVGAGVSALYAPDTVGPHERAAAEETLRAVGEVVWVDSEGALDAVTALSGSGPAYFFLFTQLLAEAGAQLGLEAPTARRLALATFYGSALMTQGDADLERLRAEVTSAGGTTAAAVRVFEAADLRGTVRAALAAAAARSRELGANQS
jgi:pyrroline-5-carboxylate reductase